MEVSNKVSYPKSIIALSSLLDTHYNPSGMLDHLKIETVTIMPIVYFSIFSHEIPIGHRS